MFSNFKEGSIALYPKEFFLLKAEIKLDEQTENN